MIKVLELVDGGFLGGGQMHILSIANNINKNIFDIVISASPAGEFRKMILRQGHRFVDINLPKIYSGSSLKHLTKIADKNEIDIIHSHGGVAGLYARMLKKERSSIKIVHTFHGFHYLNSKNIFRKFLSGSIEKYLVKYTDRFICVSDADLKIAAANNLTDPKRTVVVKNGINLQKFSNADKNFNLANRWGLKESDAVIGNISRFDYQKNQRFLIRSLKDIISQNPDVKLLLAGDGRYLEECKSLAAKFNIADKTIFTGEVNDTENYYPLIDIFIFPSLWEGLSITLIEAMASGRCIVASDIPSNRELITENKNGILFRLSNHSDLADVVTHLLNEKSKREMLSGNAIESSMDFDEKEMVIKIENIYNKVIYEPELLDAAG